MRYAVTRGFHNQCYGRVVPLTRYGPVPRWEGTGPYTHETRRRIATAAGTTEPEQEDR